MNKEAAEKIAQEYYNIGIQLALQNAGLVKTANPKENLTDTVAKDVIYQNSPINPVPYTMENATDDAISKKYKVPAERLHYMTNPAARSGVFARDLLGPIFNKAAK